MNRAAVIAMALATLIPASAIAQQTTVAPPVKWEDVPEARLRIAAPAAASSAAAAPGVTWAPPATAPVKLPVPTRAAPPPMVEPIRPPLPVRSAPPPVAAAAHPPVAHAPRHIESRRHHREAHARHGMMNHGERMMKHRGQRGINAYPDYQRVERGFAVPQRWWGPRYQVWNWGAYGLPQPMHGGRWVRYYDDALLIDPYGRVHDGRWGMNWDEYGNHWGHDDSGIPYYVGNGDFHPDERDYAFVEGHGPRHGEHGYAYGQQQGYAYPYGYGAVVTETTVTTAPTIIEKTYYVDEEVESEPRRIRARRIGTK